jgi:WD40 repeat protein
MSVFNETPVLFLIFFLSTCLSSAQKGNVEFRQIKIEEGFNYPLSSIDLLPDSTTAVIGSQTGKIFLWDINTEKVIKKFDVNGYSYGPKIKISQDGKYLLLHKQFVQDFNYNKDRKTNIEILDLENGKIVFSTADVNDAILTPDSKFVVTINGENIDVFDFISGTKVRTIYIEGATNAIAINKESTRIAVSHLLRKEDIEYIPYIRDDKKTQKTVLKFRQGVSFYDFETGTKIKTASDIFDVVYALRYTEDGNRLLVYNVASSKLQKQAIGGMGTRQGYINQINTATGEVLRPIVSSLTPDPDFKESPDNKYLAVSSSEIQGNLVQTLLLYDINSGALVHRFEVNIRVLAEKGAGLPVSFIFYPSDNRKVLLTYAGGKVAVWDY